MIPTRRAVRDAQLLLLKGESGSGLVEYAVVFIIMMTMLLAIVDFSRLLYAYHFVSNAAREAARYASVRGSTCGSVAGGGDCSCSCTGYYTASGVAGPFTQAQATTDIQDFVKNVPLGINASDPPLTTTPSWPNPNSLTTCTATFNAPGCTVEVQVSYKFNFLSALVSKKTLTLSSTSQEIITH
jgi:Flp pilus assembly protein TadG